MVETIPPLLNMRSHQQVDSPGHDEEGHEEVGHGQRHDQEVGRRPQHLLLRGKELQGYKLPKDKKVMYMQSETVQSFFKIL